MPDELTPKQRHRAGVLARWRECYGEGPHAGRLEAAHWISCQELREQRGKMLVSAFRFNDDDPRLRLLDVTLPELIADDRNGVLMCSVTHHPAFDGKRAKPLILTPPACVVEFATEYGLTHLL